MGKPGQRQRPRKSKPQSRQLKLKEICFIVSQLKEADVDVVEAFVTHHIEENEIHVSSYEDQNPLWTFLKGNRRLFVGQLMGS